jgi:hypothetical protein
VTEPPKSQFLLSFSTITYPIPMVQNGREILICL